MSTTLQGQTAIVVGASSGMGRAIAVCLAEHGAKVLAAARRQERLDDLAGKIPGIIPMAVDVTRAEDVAALMATAKSQLERVDLLVYATGTNLRDRSLRDVTPLGWQELIDTNLTGAFYCTHGVLPLMREQGGGLIVYLSSAAVQRPDVSGVAYQASKHGLVGLAHGTRLEEKGHGIRTSILYPGLCDTEILTKRPTPTPQDVLDQSLHPDDIAAAVLFLAQLPPRAMVPELQLVPARLW
ncbi:MAG TPA: SDR family oxidoreductase [Planctomycetaceae bacterium]|nr:SDR family oxidoreductase [Planctomycetaceae bacterium]